MKFWDLKFWNSSGEISEKSEGKNYMQVIRTRVLDSDSKLGHSPLSGGQGKVVSIQPPSGFGREVWEELADKGFLKRDGIGFYELVPGK